jgi:hypothetical protein
MPAKKGLTTEQVIAALKKANGNMSLAARSLGVERTNIKYYIDAHPTVKAAHDEAAAHISDIAEGHLVNAVLKGNLDQVRYWLENKARDRGYGRMPAGNPLDGMTPEQILGMTDEQLDALIAKFIRAGAPPYGACPLRPLISWPRRRLRRPTPQAPGRRLRSGPRRPRCCRC